MAEADGNVDDAELDRLVAYQLEHERIADGLRLRGVDVPAADGQLVRNLAGLPVGAETGGARAAPTAIPGTWAGAAMQFGAPLAGAVAGAAAPADSPEERLRHALMGAQMGYRVGRGIRLGAQAGADDGRDLFGQALGTAEQTARLVARQERLAAKRTRLSAGAVLALLGIAAAR